MFSRFINITVLTFALAGVNSAFAEDASSAGGANGSEFMFQTEGGKIDVTPSIQYGSTVTKYNDANSGSTNLKGTNSSTPIGVAGEYGINQMISVGLALSYQSNKTSFTCDSGNCGKDVKSKGLADPALSIKLRNAMGPGTLRYGANLAVAIEKTKYDTDGNYNAASGGTSLTPFVGYELPLGPGLIGGRLTYDLYKGDRKTTTDGVTGDTTITGGQVLTVAAFYEANVGIMTYGGALTYQSAASTKTASGSAAATDQKDATTGFGLQFYAPAHVTPTITILPTISIASNKFSSGDSPESSQGTFSIGVGGRFTF